MPIREYLYEPPATWNLLGGKHGERRLLREEADISDALFSRGYQWIAQSGAGDCGIGWFTVWQKVERDPAMPRYAVEVNQQDDESVVWIDHLPVLWEFCRRYAGIGWSMPAHSEPSEPVICNDCREAMEADDEDNERCRLVELESRRHDDA